MKSPVRVVIVDDSRTIRAMLRKALESDPAVSVVGEAGDPYQARDVIKASDPDVITLDVEMPRMNGLVFLEHLMRLRPMPVVMVSNRTKEKSEAAVKALSLGAIDCIDLARLHADPRATERVIETVKIAARAKVQARQAAAPGRSVPKPKFAPNGRIVLIGSSTGGVDALEKVFASFPRNCPPTLVAQHMPAPFLASFSRRLDDRVDPRVRLAGDGAPIRSGTILLAPGGRHHMVMGHPRRHQVQLCEDDGTERYIPAVRRLFGSATGFGRRIVAVMLTGMGRDGAEEMLALKESGAETIIQSSSTCVVDGMPGAARNLGAGTQDVDLDKIGAAILAACAAKEGQHIDA